MILTVCCSIQDNKSSVDQSLKLPILEFDSIGVPAQPIGRFVDIYIVVCPIERP